jgi:alcohol dehydrogenase (cytochrome c)
MDPKQAKQSTNRGAAFWGNLVISPANEPPRMVATDKERGKVVWETNLVNNQTGVRISGAPLAIKDKIIVGASGGDGGVRDWIAALDAATGKQLWLKYTIRPLANGSETWKDKTTPGDRRRVPCGDWHPTESDSNQTIWGTGNRFR